MHQSKEHANDAMFFGMKCRFFLEFQEFYTKCRGLDHLCRWFLSIKYSYQLDLKPSLNMFKWFLIQLTIPPKAGPPLRNSRGPLWSGFMKTHCFPLIRPAINPGYSWGGSFGGRASSTSFVGIWPSTLVMSFVDVLWHVSSRCLDRNRFFSATEGTAQTMFSLVIHMYICT